MWKFDHIKYITEIVNHPINKNRKIGAFIDYFRWNIGRRLLSADYIFPLANDSSIILSNRQNYATLSYLCALWDFEEMLFLTHLLRPGDLFADIGANVGGYTVLASAVAGAHAIAFEPVPATHAELLRNLRLNAITELVEACQCALGEQAGRLRMTAELGGMNHVALPTEARPTVEVPIRRLDEVLGGRGCTMMKLDAEGFEVSILAGAPDALANPALLALVVELNGSGLRYGHSDESVHGAILRHGFAPFRYDPVARRLARQESYNVNGLNTLYVRNLDRVEPLLAAAPKVRVRETAF